MVPYTGLPLFSYPQRAQRSATAFCPAAGQLSWRLAARGSCYMDELAAAAAVVAMAVDGFADEDAAQRAPSGAGGVRDHRAPAWVV